MTPSTEIKHLTHEELDDLLRTIYDAGNVRDIALFTTIYHWALRAAEASDLKLSDLNLESNQGVIRSKKGGIDATLTMIDTQGTPHWNQKKALRRYVAERRRTGQDYTEYVFASQKGGSLDPDSVNRLFKKYVADTNARRAVAGKPLIAKSVTHVHALRHTFCTLNADAGISVNDVRLVARHRSIQTSLKYYVHGSPLLASKRIQSRISDIQRAAA